MQKVMIWVDDVRPAPAGYILAQSVNRAKALIEFLERPQLPNCEDCDLIEKDCHAFCDKHDLPANEIWLVDLDHDAGDFANDGGDYIKLLDWFEETGRNYTLRFHSMNPVGIQNMRAIAEHNGWRVI